MRRRRIRVKLKRDWLLIAFMLLWLWAAAMVVKSLFIERSGDWLQLVLLPGAAFCIGVCWMILWPLMRVRYCPQCDVEMKVIDPTKARRQWIARCPKCGKVVSTGIRSGGRSFGLGTKLMDEVQKAEQERSRKV